MDGTTKYVARANIDHFLGLLDKNDLPTETRGTITKLLIAEEDKLGRDLEQLEFAERRAAMGRERLHRLKNLRSSFIAGSTDRVEADRVLANCEAIQHIMEHFCNRIREKVNSSCL